MSPIASMTLESPKKKKHNNNTLCAGLHCTLSVQFPLIFSQEMETMVISWSDTVACIYSASYSTSLKQEKEKRDIAALWMNAKEQMMPLFKSRRKNVCSGV